MKVQGLFESQRTRFICKFWSVFMLLDPDPDGIPNTNPGLGKPNDCRSAWIRIHNTAYGNFSVLYVLVLKLIVALFSNKLKAQSGWDLPRTGTACLDLDSEPQYGPLPADPTESGSRSENNAYRYRSTDTNCFTCTPCK